MIALMKRVSAGRSTFSLWPSLSRFNGLFDRIIRSGASRKLLFDDTDEQDWNSPIYHMCASEHLFQPTYELFRRRFVKYDSNKYPVSPTFYLLGRTVQSHCGTVALGIGSCKAGHELCLFTEIIE